MYSSLNCLHLAKVSLLLKASAQSDGQVSATTGEALGLGVGEGLLVEGRGRDGLVVLLVVVGLGVCLGAVG